MSEINSCRSCSSESISKYLDLGVVPLADRLLSRKQLDEPEPRYPLQVVFCHACGLSQITTTVDPAILFRDEFSYYSSFIDTVLDNARDSVRQILSRKALGPDSLVVEIASNDGYLLKNFVDKDIPVLGIDPADGPVEQARRVGVESLCEFFGIDLANRLVADGRSADVIIGNNVLAHVADTNGLVAGIARLLKPDGIVVIEVPYVRDLIDHCEFDTIYHEHLCYFSAHSFRNLFARHGLHLNDVQRLSIHGGSLRCFAGHESRPTAALTELLDEERRLGVTGFDYYRDFGSRVERLCGELRALLAGLKSEGKSIAGYGAAAKGATLINFVDIGGDLVDYVVDRNTHKQGRYMPGKRQPILAPDHLINERPDYLLLFAWNHAPEIMKQLSAYTEAGGRFIVPIPDPRIV